MRPTITANIQGKATQIPCYVVDGVTLIVTGKLLRVARIFDEDWLDIRWPSPPGEFAMRIRQAGVPADVFTFTPKLAQKETRFPFHKEHTNLAVAPCADFEHWWQDRLARGTRKHCRRAWKENIVVRELEFNHDLIIGLKAIYDEVPYRQGRPFWHHDKSLETIRRDNATHLDRSILLGAFRGSELVGFLKLVLIGPNAHVLQLISKVACADKKPNNALLCEAVRVCSGRSIEHLVYGQYIYGKSASSLTEFKRRNGFEMVALQRYFIATSAWGKVALGLGLHRELRRFVPAALEPWLRGLWHWLDRMRMRSRVVPRGPAPSVSPQSSGPRAAGAAAVDRPSIQPSHSTY